MSRDKAKLLNLAPRRPGQRPAPSEEELKRIEDALEARGNGIAGQAIELPPPVQPVQPAERPEASRPTPPPIEIVERQNGSEPAPRPIETAERPNGSQPAERLDAETSGAQTISDVNELLRGPAPSIPGEKSRGGRGVVERVGRLRADGSRTGARLLRRMTVYMPPELARDLDMHAIQTDANVSDVIAKAVRAYLEPK